MGLVMQFIYREMCIILGNIHCNRKREAYNIYCRLMANGTRVSGMSSGTSW